MHVKFVLIYDTLIYNMKYKRDMSTYFSVKHSPDLDTKT